MNFLNFTYGKGSREAFLHKEIQRSILPLLLPLKPEVIEFHLAKLVGETNRTGRPHWTVSPATIALNNLRFGERVLRIQGTRWIVSKVALAAGPREAIFLDVISSMENGDLGRLRRCPICEKFFIAKDFRQELCGSIQCKKSRNRDTARIRVGRKRLRDRKRKINAKQNPPRRVSDGFQRFCEYMNLREKRSFSDAELDQLGEITKELPKRNQTPLEWDNQLRRGSSLKDIWGTLAQPIRSVFNNPYKPA